MALRSTQRVFLLAVSMAAGTSLVTAQAAEVRLLCSNGLRAVVEGLQSEFERTSGHRLSTEFSATAVLKQRILDGATFDVAILTSDVIDELGRAGRVRPSTRTELARTGIGVGYRSGARRPDVRTADALKASLLNAKSIVYAREGASRPHIDRMLTALGLVDALRPKTSLVGPGQSPQAVATGESEIVMTLISEILPVAGVELAGPLPAEFQNHVVFAAASTKAATAGVKALVSALTSAQAAGLYTKNGMEPR